jgi:hypothetical protein
MTSRLLLFALFLGSTFLHGAGYRFTMEGKEFEPSILPVRGERKGAFTRGDLVHTHGFPFVLGDPGHYQFRIAGNESSQLFCKVNDQAEHCLSVIVKREEIPAPFKDDQSEMINPLRKMTPGERRHLRGINLRAPLPKKQWTDLTQGVDWSRTILRVDGGTGHSITLPMAPTSLRYLELSCADGRELTFLPTLTNLLYLRLQAIADLDLTLLAKMIKLRNLDLDSGSVKNASALSKLPTLRFLKIRRVQGLKNVTFARSLPLLRVFKIDHSEVTDLRPVEACSELRLLSASGAQIKHLPAGSKLPNLRDFRLLSTPAAKDTNQIAAFRKATPQCLLHLKWREALLSKLGHIDRVLIRGRALPPAPNPEIIIEDSEKIASLLQCLDLEEEQAGRNGLCEGDPWLEFYRGKKLIATIGFHHGALLRWHKGLWPSDATITPECARALCEFMAAEGLEAPGKNLLELPSGKQTESLRRR